MDFAQVLPRLQAVTPRTRTALEGLPPAQFTAAPAAGGWSIAQIFEHLCLNSDLYLDRTLPEGIARAKASRHGARDWRPSWIGGFLIRAMLETSTRKVPAPARFQVGPSVRPNVVEDFLAGIARLETSLRALEGADLRTGIASPISPLLRMNVGDACMLLTEHAHRHLAQVERTRRALGG